MTTPRKNRNATLAAFAAFGIASLGSISLAAAHPDSTPRNEGDRYDDRHDDHYRGDRGLDYDLDDDGVLEHVEIDYRHYDRDRDGTLDRGERSAYWAHMIDMGKFGRDFTPADRAILARIAFLFDTDEDGRLTSGERVAIGRLIRARRLFTELDRNRDNLVTRREARQSTWYRGGDRHYGNSNEGFSYLSRFWEPRRSNNWVAQRFQTLDLNDNGNVSWQEVQNYIIRSFRRGDR